MKSGTNKVKLTLTGNSYNEPIQYILYEPLKYNRHGNCFHSKERLYRGGLIGRFYNCQAKATLITDLVHIEPIIGEREYV